MIQFTNIKKYDNVPFSDYMKVPGFSHSFLKREVQGSSPEFIMSDKVELGNLVDAILTQPDKLDIYSPQLKRAEKIAKYILDSPFGSLIPSFLSQPSYSLDMTYRSFIMPAKVRLDWGIVKIAPIDLKVTAESNFKAIIEHMQYDNQLFIQAAALEAKDSYLLMYSSKTNECQLISRPLNTGEFWKEKILKFGTFKS